MGDRHGRSAPLVPRTNGIPVFAWCAAMPAGSRPDVTDRRPMRPRPAQRGGFALTAIAGVLMVALAAGIVIGTAAAIDAGLGGLGGRGSAAPDALGAAASARPGASGSAHASLDSSASLPVGPLTTPDASTAPVETPEPSAGVVLDPPPAPGPFSIDLYRKGDFVSELEPIWCVPAAMQTMMNVIGTDQPDRTKATQRRLYKLARLLSTEKLKGPGAEPEGWADGLNQLGYGPYVVAVAPTRRAAVAQAAVALRMTGRPVGLLTWKGAHSWVMSGFEATADPAWTDDFTVTGLYVEDVWYPAISKLWGPSLPPDSLDPIEKLGIDFLPWRRPTARYPDKDGRFVLVLPTLDEPALPGP